MRKDRQGGEKPLDDHAYIGTGIRGGDEDEALTSLQVLANDLARVLPEFFELTRVDVELAHFSLGVPLQALMEGKVPAVAEPQHLEHAPFRQVAADLLRHAYAHMLDNLFGASHMRRYLGDRFDDQVQVADRATLGKQQFQPRLQAGI